MYFLEPCFSSFNFYNLDEKTRKLNIFKVNRLYKLKSQNLEIKERKREIKVFLLYMHRVYNNHQNNLVIQNISFIWTFFPIMMEFRN